MNNDWKPQFHLFLCSQTFVTLNRCVCHINHCKWSSPYSQKFIRWNTHFIVMELLAIKSCFFSSICMFCLLYALCIVARLCCQTANSVGTCILLILFKYISRQYVVDATTSMEPNIKWNFNSNDLRLQVTTHRMSCSALWLMMTFALHSVLLVDGDQMTRQKVHKRCYVEEQKTKTKQVLGQAIQWIKSIFFLNLFSTVRIRMDEVIRVIDS